MATNLVATAAFMKTQPSQKKMVAMSVVFAAISIIFESNFICVILSISGLV